jgi:hypothetical protein
MPYWMEIVKRAFRAAARDAKLDTAANIFGVVFGQILISIILFLLSGNFQGVNWQTRIATTLLPFLLFPAMFLFRMVVEPAVLHKEQIDALARAEVVTDKIAVREKLGAFLISGNILLVKCRNEKIAVSETIPLVDVWCSEVGEYLQARLDSSYLARFSNPSRAAFMPTGVASSEHIRLWNFVFNHVETIRAFIQEFL